MKKSQLEAARKALIDSIREHIKANNITQEEIEKKTGFIQSNISRMLQAKYSPTLDNLLLLCYAVGMKVEVKSILYNQQPE